MVLNNRFWRFGYRYVEARNHRLRMSEDVSPTTSITTRGACPNVNLYTKLTKRSTRGDNFMWSKRYKTQSF